MNRLKNSMYRFLYGRYGVDQLSRTIVMISVFVYVINLFWWHSAIVSTVVWVLLLWNIYRCYSKQIYKRRAENEAFLMMSAGIRRRFTLMKKQRLDQTHKYFMCPNCKQFVRVPKGHGKITITCPSCHHRFDGKS